MKAELMEQESDLARDFGAGPAGTARPTGGLPALSPCSLPALFPGLFPGGLQRLSTGPGRSFWIPKIPDPDHP